MEDLRIGMVGLDTSHCPAFAQLLHDRSAPHWVPGARVVVAFPGGSRAFAPSYTRVERFTEQMRTEFGVEVVDSIEAVAERCDAVFLESSDGRQHLEQFRRLAPARKPVFIDKPLATSLAEAREIFALAERHGTPVMSCSALRYSQGIAALAAGERVQGAVASGPAELRPDFPGYFWYGIHAAEVLFTKMGRGCRRVRVEAADQADVITAHWADGRVGAVVAHRLPGCHDFACTVFTEHGVQQATNREGPPDYARMLPHVLDFCRTRQPAVDPAETLEIVAFLEAANRSRETGEAVELAAV
jgi:predicted dehydrogenase